MQFKFLAKRGHTHFEGSKSKVKNVVKIIEKFKNRLEVLKWHENNTVGPFRGENEIHIFSFFILLSPKMDTGVFIDKYRQVNAQSTRNRLEIIFK